MFEENKIQDIFRQASLENEDWLEPSPLVFQNIEDAIYKRKRKRWFLFWITSILGVLVFFGYWQFNKHQLSNNSVNQTTLKQPLAKEITVQNENNLTKEEINTDNFESEKTSSKTSTNSVHPENQIKSNTAKKAINSNVDSKDELKEALITKSKFKNSSNNINPNKKPINKAKNNNFISKNPISQNISNLKLKNNNLKKEAPIEKVRGIIENTTNENLSFTNDDSFVKLSKSTINEVRAPYYKEKISVKRHVKKLNSILPILESDNIDYKTIKNLDDITKPSFKQATTLWSYNIVSGFSYWDYSLNNNYKRLLKPADFDFTNGKGYFAALQAQKTLNEKFSVIGNLGFETVYSKSGHNSIFDYDPLNEDSEAISSFDIKMASTMGFIDANVQVLRQNDVSIDATAVTIDLNNKHKISSIDLSAYLLAKLLTVNNFNASVSLGLGVAQIVKVKNELASFTTSLQKLSPHKSTIVANQADLNKTRSFIGFGIYLNHQIDATNNLFINYSFKSDLNALYKSGEFSTFLNKHNIGLGYHKKF